MSESEETKYDTRQLEKYRNFRRQIPGEPRLHYLEGPPEKYVLSAWHVRIGEAIPASGFIAKIEADSFTLDLEVFESGVLIEQCFAVGEIIPDGAVIARIAISRTGANP